MTWSMNCKQVCACFFNSIQLSTRENVYVFNKTNMLRHRWKNFRLLVSSDVFFFFCFSKSNKLKLCKCHCCLKWPISCRCEVLNHRKIIHRRNFLIEFITNDCENIASLSTWCSCRNKKKERAKLDLLIDWLMFYIYSEKKIRLTLLMSLIWSQIC